MARPSSQAQPSRESSGSDSISAFPTAQSLQALSWQGFAFDLADHVRAREIAFVTRFSDCLLKLIGRNVRQRVRALPLFDTLFRRWKRETYRGGASDPFIVHWPAGIKARGEVRDQYAHLIDMVPTVLVLPGIEPPATIKGVTQAPLHGVSFEHAIEDPDAVSNRHTQYFEMLGHRSIYHDGWRAWPGPSFTEIGKGFGEAIPAQKLTELDAQGWELYQVAEDFAENHNRASENREKLIEMVGRRYVEVRQVRRAARRRHRAGPSDG